MADTPIIGTRETDMAGTGKSFSDLNGQTVELVGYLYGMDNAKFAATFPGIKGYRYDSFAMQVGRSADNRELPVTRKVTYKAFASKHECDARCMFAKGRTMNCECSCGGKNHGKGGASYACEAA